MNKIISGMLTATLSVSFAAAAVIPCECYIFLCATSRIGFV